ncbi:MAG TPA: glycosyl hydrolase family 18 protein [Cyclobacteriaceae bacterium]|nr:glycosyl hydrolase family 18 protein [Cyclobacteriaceae bacterium]
MKKTFTLTLSILLVGIFFSYAQICDQFVGGYVPSYRDPATVDYTKLSHAFYGFATTNAQGGLIVDQPVVFNSFKTASAGKQRFLSLAGGGGAEAFSSMTSSSASIQAFADSCAKFCVAQNFQGIDVDWEGITTKEDSVKYGNLMRALATALHAKELQLVATLGYGGYGGDFYNVGALKQADWIQLMVYDQTGTWADSPYGNHASYQMMLDAITYWTGRGYNDVSKIVIGLPFYGYKFNSASGGLATAKTYSEIVAAYPNLGCDVDETNLTVFNGPETIRKKVQYVMTNGLKGVMIWEMGQDISSSNSKSLLNTISKATCELPAACNDIVSALPPDIERQLIVLVKNPVTDILSINVVNESDIILSVELLDNFGRVVMRRQSSSSLSDVNISEHAAGVYLVRTRLQNNKICLNRIIKI